MIREVTRFDIKNYKIFPKLQFKTEIGDGFKSNEILIRTHVPVNDYLIILEKRFNYILDDGLDYTHFMIFIDKVMNEVNNIKINFKPELFQDNEIGGILKIVDYGF